MTQTLSGVLNTGITLTAGGAYTSPFTVTSAGTIASGGGFGVFSSLAAAALLNQGMISGGSTAGLEFVSGGALTNQGVLAGAGNGVMMQAAGTVENNGLISGAAFTGVDLKGGGTIGNYGTIAGYTDGVVLVGAGFIGNHGTIDCALTGYDGVAGVYLAGADTLNNAGDISGIFAGAYFKASGTLINSGTISALRTNLFAGSGVILAGGGRGSNTGAIYGFRDGVNVGGGGVFNNGGVITCSPVSLRGSFGVALLAGGTLMNSGTIAGAIAGVYLYKGGTVSNASNGTITGDYGIQFAAGGTAVNFGVIDGSLLDVALDAGSSFTNDGTLIGADGIRFTNGGVAINNATIAVRGFGVGGGAGGTLINNGVISGNNGGVHLTQGATVINNGTINNGVYFGAYPAATFRLVVGDTAVFNGTVESGSLALSTLEFASGAGVLGTLGGQFTGFETLQFDAGASWLVSATAPAVQGESIIGFAAGDTLVLDGFSETTTGFANGALTLSDGVSSETLDFAGALSLGSFVITDVAAGTQIELCYLRGTEILTQAGPRAVEELRIGDAVVTKFGGVQAVKWIGRQDFAAAFLAKTPARYPVRIRAGALGAGLPGRDLYVSPGHSVLLGETLLLAKNLVNGVTVTQNDLPELVAYYAIELEHHDCVLAEGVWAESFADGPGLRHQFHNAAEYFAAHCDFVAPETIALCAARPESGPALDAALRPLVARAACEIAPGVLRGWVERCGADGCIAGWAQDEAHPDLPVLLEICAGEMVIGTVLACDYRADLAQAGLGRGHAGFSFVRPADSLPLHGAIHVRRRGDGAGILHLARAA